MGEQKVTKDIIVQALEKWLKTHKNQILPLSYDAVQQLYEVLTEEKPGE